MNKASEGFVATMSPEILVRRLQIAWANWQGDRDRLPGFIEMTEQSVGEFFFNSDHGLKHSLKVAERAFHILDGSFSLRESISSFSGLETHDVKFVLYWSAIMHDLMRFFEYSTKDHEEPAGQLALSAFGQEDAKLAQEIYLCVFRHDYFCKIVDGVEMPEHFFSSPPADILRLADKTSLSPVQEVQRWWDCGKRFGTTFFDPSLSDTIRFDLAHNYQFRDQLTYMLMIFALQASDFAFPEVQEQYALWGEGKGEAILEIVRLAREVGHSQEEIDEIMAIIARFYYRFVLEPIPECLRHYIF